MVEVYDTFPGLSLDREPTDVDTEEPLGKEVKKLAFEGYLDDMEGCAKWGPSYGSSVLVEREEYIRLWDLLCAKSYRYILIRGSKGIGKSVFIYWLIYRIMKEADKDGKGPYPTFLLIRSGGLGKVYHFLCVEDGVAVTKRVGPDAERADYVLSDVEYDAAVMCSKWNLNVISYGSQANLKAFINELEGVGQVSVLIYTFLSCTMWPLVLLICPLLPLFFRPGSMR